MKDKSINEAIQRLEELGPDFHGHRSEIWAVLAILFAQGEKSGMRDEQEARRGVSWQEATA